MQALLDVHATVHNTVIIQDFLASQSMLLIGLQHSIMSPDHLDRNSDKPGLSQLLVVSV